MADFLTSDKFNASKSFVQVEFGSDAMLLEVELNEMQKIQNYLRGLPARKLMTNGFLAMPTMSLASGTLTVPADTLLVNGDFLEITEAMTISASPNDVIYMSISGGVEISSLSTIKTNGNLSGGSTITNDLIDARVGSETSRRVQKQLQLTKSNTDPSKTYLPVATITNTSIFVDNRTKLSFSSPALTGIPTAPTAPIKSNTTQVANAAFVANELADLQMVINMGGMV